MFFFTIPYKRKFTGATENYNPYKSENYEQLLTPKQNSKCSMSVSSYVAGSKPPDLLLLLISIDAISTLNFLIITIMQLLCA
jgi:hypothetical protein